MVMRRAHVGVVRPFPVINVIADGPQAAFGASRYSAPTAPVNGRERKARN